eukprot:364163-Chlamydomonas_euryale.AAC.2
MRSAACDRRAEPGARLSNAHKSGHVKIALATKCSTFASGAAALGGSAHMCASLSWLSATGP